jgi:hypothetical protein
MEMNQTIMGLSVWQPWASLIANSAKKIATQTWPTNYRGLVAIHAWKNWPMWDKDLVKIAVSRKFREALFGDKSYEPATTTATGATIARANNIVLASNLPRDCFIALGKIQNCISTTEQPKLIPPVTSDEYHFGDYSPDMWMWVFEEIWKLREPVYAPGHRRKLWKLNEGEADVVLAMLPDGIEEQLQQEKE